LYIFAESIMLVAMLILLNSLNHT